MFYQKKVTFRQQYSEHMHLEIFNLWSSSEKLFKKTLYPKMTHVCKALKPIDSYYFCIAQVLRGQIWRIQIQIYTKSSIEPKYGAFYLKNEVSVLLQSLLVELS